MSALALHRALFWWVLFSPLLIMAVGLIAAGLLKKRRWIVHILVFAAMITSMPIYLHIQWTLDPTSMEYPGPGDGIGFLLWLICLVVAIVLYAASLALYAVGAWFMRRKRRSQFVSTVF
jgi:hypothetical protein